MQLITDFPLDAIHLFIQATTASSRDVTAIKNNCIFEPLHATGITKCLDNL